MCNKTVTQLVMFDVYSVWKWLVLEYIHIFMIVGIISAFWVSLTKKISETINQSSIQNKLICIFGTILLPEALWSLGTIRVKNSRQSVRIQLDSPGDSFKNPWILAI